MIAPLSVGVKPLVFITTIERFDSVAAHCSFNRPSIGWVTIRACVQRRGCSSGGSYLKGRCTVATGKSCSDARGVSLVFHGSVAPVFLKKAECLRTGDGGINKFAPVYHFFFIGLPFHRAGLYKQLSVDITY